MRLFSINMGEGSGCLSNSMSHFMLILDGLVFFLRPTISQRFYYAWGGDDALGAEIFAHSTNINTIRSR